MKICFFNYIEPAGAKWDKIIDHSEDLKNFQFDFVISNEKYRGHKLSNKSIKLITNSLTSNKKFNKLIFNLKSIKFFILSKYDLYIILTQPPLFYLLATFILKLRGKKYYLYLMDLYIEYVVINSKSKLMNSILLFSKPSYMNAHKIFVIGRDMKNMIERLYSINNKKFFYQRNWATVNSDLSDKGKYSNETYGLYAGNMSYFHDFTQIKEMLIQLRNHKILDKFYFVGKGKRKSELEQFSKQNNLQSFIEFKGFLSDEEFIDITNNALFHTIALNRKSTGISVPSKFYTSIETLKPILFFGSRNSELSKDIMDYNLGEVIDTKNVDYIKIINKFLNNDYSSNLSYFKKNINNADIAAKNILKFIESDNLLNI